MKKLMVAIAAVASAFGLYADGLDNQIDFEDSYLNVGDALDVTKTDAGAGAEGTTRGWYSATPEETGVAALDETLNQKVLAVDNSSPLYRTVVPNNGTMVPQVIDESGIFFDTTVKFTVGDIETQNLDTGAKLAIWVGADEEATTPYTNLYVTAGSIAGQTITATNFTAKLPANFDFNAWHRVTVRTIKQAVDNQTVPGFVIFIDGNENAIECADADYATKIGSFTASSAAAEFLTDKKLFLSLVESDASEAQKVSGLGFSGSGSLANVGITDYDHAPEFARPAKVFELSWTAGVTGFTANGEVISGLTEAGTTNITLTTGDQVAVSGVNYADGYMKGTWVNYDEAKGAFVWTAGNRAGSIVADKVAFMIGDAKYATFADALADAVAAGKPTTITLAASIDGWEAVATINDANADVTLDLAGKTLTFADYTDAAVFSVQSGNLTVIDSVGNGKIVAAPATTSVEWYGVFYSEGLVNIGLDDGDEGVTIDGLVGDGIISIVKGKFDKDNNKTAAGIEAFVLDKNTYEVVSDGDYWKVQKTDKKPITPDDDPVELDVDPEASEADAQAAANKLDFDITDEEKDAGLTKDKVYAKAVRNEADTAWVAVVEIKPEFAPAVKEEASIEVTDVNFGATVKEPVVGLYYGFVAVDALDGETDFAPVGTYQRATSTDPLKLTAPKGEGDARFYKLNASLFDRSVKE